jgi:hypothetical protein
VTCSHKSQNVFIENPHESQNIWPYFSVKVKENYQTLLTLCFEMAVSADRHLCEKSRLADGVEEKNKH